MDNVDSLSLPTFDIGNIPELPSSGEWHQSLTGGSEDATARKVGHELTLYDARVNKLSQSVTQYRAVVAPYLESPTDDAFSELAKRKMHIGRDLNAVRETIPQLETLLKPINNGAAADLRAQLKTATKFIDSVKNALTLDLEGFHVDYEYAFQRKNDQLRTGSPDDSTPPASLTPTRATPEPDRYAPQQRPGHQSTSASTDRVSPPKLGRRL